MSTVAGPPADTLTGRQTPTQELLCPAHTVTAGDQAIALADHAGLHLDPWQQRIVRNTMGLREDGYWAAFESLYVVSRRNGKSTAIAARVLAGLFLLGEKEIVWSAHRYDTAMDAFKLIKQLITSTPDLKQELARTRNNGISTTHGDESITLRTGARVRFKTRTADGGRGLDGDLVIIDEAQSAQHIHLSAMLPTLAARPNPQVIYAGSAGGSKSYVMGDLIARAFGRDADPEHQARLYVALWSMEEGDDRAAPETWAKANPALGLRMELETMRGFYQTWRYRPAYFDQEHLGLGNYPRPEGETWIIPSVDWSIRERDPAASSIVDQPVLVIEGRPDLAMASISAAGHNAFGQTHMEVVAQEHGTRWILDRVPVLLESGPYAGDGPVVMDSRSPLRYLVPDLEQLGVEVRLLTPDEFVDASAWFLESGTEQSPTGDAGNYWLPQWVHPPQAVATIALAALSVRPRSDRVVLSRQSGDTDVSPIIGMALAGYALQLLGRSPAPPPSPELVSERFGPSRPTGIGGANF